MIDTVNTIKGFDVSEIRKQFPILKRMINGFPLVYLDNAASTQKPQVVLDAEFDYYTQNYSNIHRGVHTLSQIGTTQYEETRKVAQQFINAEKESEIIFTKGTTDGINLIAHSFGTPFLKEGDEVLITEMEHHSNIVPWQMICEKQNATLKFVPLQPDGTLLVEDFKKLITDKTKLVSVTYVSNSLGTVNPIKEIIKLAHDVGAKVLIDCAQAIQHKPIDVQALDVDFIVFSGHKMYGPTGTGILYGKESLLDAMIPYQGGGDMIKEVKMSGTTYNELPFKFEAGTPNIAGMIALKAAFEFINDIGLSVIQTHEDNLLRILKAELEAIEGIIFIGKAENKSGAISFLVDGAHPYDVGTLLDNLGIAIRTGHHCTQPVMDYYKILGTCRASFAVYNTEDEIEYFIYALKKAMKMLR